MTWCFHRSAADAVDSALWWNLQRGEIWQSETAGHRQQSADGYQCHSHRSPALHTCTHPVRVVFLLFCFFFILFFFPPVIPAFSPSGVLFFNVLSMSHLPAAARTVINWLAPLTCWIFIAWICRCFSKTVKEKCIQIFAWNALSN